MGSVPIKTVCLSVCLSKRIVHAAGTHRVSSSVTAAFACLLAEVSFFASPSVFAPSIRALRCGSRFREYGRERGGG